MENDIFLEQIAYVIEIEEYNFNKIIFRSTDCN